jgi:hypothetical protein
MKKIMINFKNPKKWLTSQGLVVNQPESIPKDPYIEKRQEKIELKTYKTKTDYDKLKQFIEMDRKVLRFYAIWDDRHTLYGESRQFIIQYYLVDDTMEVREVHKANDGRDPFPVLITRQKVPKDRYNVKANFPHIYLELSDKEIDQYYKPHDFAIGKTVPIYGRNFLIYDMDNFSKAFYYQSFGITDFPPLQVEKNSYKSAKMVKSFSLCEKKTLSQNFELRLFNPFSRKYHPTMATDP